MNLFDVNWIGVVAAALTGFLVGGIWYGPIMGKKWMGAVGLTEEQIKEGNMGLIYGGAFAFSRNPIYLADLIVLVGWLMIWGAAAPFVLIPAFAWIINTRFIAPEEARLQAAFGEAFTAYAARTRRWI